MIVSGKHILESIDEVFNFFKDKLKEKIIIQSKYAQDLNKLIASNKFGEMVRKFTISFGNIKTEFEDFLQNEGIAIELTLDEVMEQLASSNAPHLIGLLTNEKKRLSFLKIIDTYGYYLPRFIYSQYLPISNEQLDLILNHTKSTETLKRVFESCKKTFTSQNALAGSVMIGLVSEIATYTFIESFCGYISNQTISNRLDRDRCRISKIISNLKSTYGEFLSNTNHFSNNGFKEFKANIKSFDIKITDDLDFFIRTEFMTIIDGLHSNRIGRNMILHDTNLALNNLPTDQTNISIITSNIPFWYRLLEVSYIFDQLKLKKGNP